MRYLAAFALMTLSLYAAGLPQPLELKSMPLRCLKNQLASKQISSEALVQQYLATASDKTQLNAWITLDGENALKRAKELDTLARQGHSLGPLHGIPLAIKDNIHVAGITNTGGTPLLKNFVPTQDAAVITSLKQAGAIILGKTNMHELAYGITSNNYAFGAVANAYNDQYFGGGSSGGTAVAIAAGMAAAGLGTDTGGSSRIPSALNGIAGFRPTTGRYSAEGLLRISDTRDTVGPMAHSVADIVLLDQVLTSSKTLIEPRPLKGLRLGVPKTPFYQQLEPSVEQAVNKTLTRLRQAGAILIEADMPEVSALNNKIGFPMVIYETAQQLNQYASDHRLNFSLKELAQSIASPDVKALMKQVANHTVSEQAYLQAKQTYRPQLQQLYRDYFAKHKVEAIVYPTTPLTARPIKDSLKTVPLHGNIIVPTFPTYIRNTDPSSNAGIPSVTLPIGQATNLMPIGLGLDGPQHSDTRLLAIGMAIENLLHPHPEVCGQTLHH
jgi:indoleacetamide hydrolase